MLKSDILIKIVGIDNMLNLKLTTPLTDITGLPTKK